jgi:hypothetical protein
LPPTSTSATTAAPPTTGPRRNLASPAGTPHRLSPHTHSSPTCAPAPSATTAERCCANRDLGERTPIRVVLSLSTRTTSCGDNLLTADQPPQSPEQWERWWLSVTRKAVLADYLTHRGKPGQPEDDGVADTREPPVTIAVLPGQQGAHAPPPTTLRVAESRRATRSSASNSLSYAARRPAYLMTSPDIRAFWHLQAGGIQDAGAIVCGQLDSSAGWAESGASTITTSVRPGVRP